MENRCPGAEGRSDPIIKAVLIDLDGTLLDTAGDLAAAANAMLAALGRPPRTLEEVKTYVGKGIARLVERCLTGDLDAKADAALLERALALFRSAYEQTSGRASALYPGVVEGLEAMAASGLRIACVTNKAARFTTPLLERAGLAPRFAAVVCGDMVERGKPDPMCYLVACERLGVRPEEALVVGDSENDALAARAAGMRVLCVPYGYNEGRPVESLDCDAIVPDLRAAAAYVSKVR
jgi:phosphoglycolate phosphatase